MYTIELYLPPGNPRPDDLIDGVLKDTGVNVGGPVSKVFGNWTWVIPKEQETLYEQHRETVEARIKALYEDGVIRYGSW